jgi:hypothetical protein
MRRLIHYSREPLVAVRSTEQADEPSHKPRGLWVSAEGDDDWKRWCLDADFRTENLSCETEIVVRPDARILTIESEAELDTFHNTYAVLNRPWHDSAPDWRKVAERWQGIVICPYQWSRRHTLMWYYSWDCASGCFWDASAIAIPSEVKL